MRTHRDNNSKFRRLDSDHLEEASSRTSEVRRRLGRPLAEKAIRGGEQASRATDGATSQPSNDSRGRGRAMNARSNPIGNRSAGDETGPNAIPPGNPGEDSQGAQPEARRQFERELRERLAEAQELKDLVGRDATLGNQLNNVISRLRQIDPSRVFNDPSQMDLLKYQLVDPLRQLQFELSRKLQEALDRNALRLSDDAAVPESYRRRVEDYYKRLSRRPNQ